VISTILKQVEAAVGRAEKAEGAVAVARMVTQAEEGVNVANPGFWFLF